jgi:hypothetical protein
LARFSAIVLAGDRHAVAVQEAVVEQRLHQQRHAAGLEHVLGDIRPPGFRSAM